MAEKKKKVWFEKCNCSAAKGAHGYFHAEGNGKCPVPTFSMEAGEIILNGLAGEYGLSEADQEEVRDQMRAAELTEKSTGADREVSTLYLLDRLLTELGG